MKQAKAKREPNAGSWRSGQSGNVNGRPRTGLAFAEAVRARIDPHRVLDLVERHFGDEEVPIAARLNTLLPYIHAGFVRPPSGLDVNVSQHDEPLRDVSKLTEDELRTMIALEEKMASAGDDPRLPEPQGADDELPRDTPGGTH